jgi:methylmalonyl-CoA decarboxylase
MPLLESKIEGFVGTICLDYFEKRNAFSAALVEDFVKALEAFAEGRIRAVVLRAKPGVRIWSAGHDVDELPEGRRDPLGWYDPLRRLVRTIENHPAPVIAMIEGGVWGGACEAAMACDIVVCAPSAPSALTPANLGVPYNVSGMLTFLNSASLRLIKEMALTAKPIPADRALHAGLVNHLMPEADLEPFTGALAADIVDNAPLSIAVMKEELRVLAGAHMMSPQGWERVQGLRRVIYDSADYVEGLRASATPCASAGPTPPMSAGRSCALP